MSDPLENKAEIKAYVKIDSDTDFVATFVFLPHIGDEIVLRDTEKTYAKVTRVVHNLSPLPTLPVGGYTASMIQVFCERITK